MGWTDRQEVRERKEAGVVSPVYLYRSPAAWTNATELLQDRQRQVTGLILRILQFNSPYQRAPEDVSFSCFILCAVIRKCNSVYTPNNWTHLMEVNIDRGLAITGSEQVWTWGDTRLLEGKNCSWRNAFPADSCYSCFLSSPPQQVFPRLPLVTGPWVTKTLLCPGTVFPLCPENGKRVKWPLPCLSLLVCRAGNVNLHFLPHETSLRFVIHSSNFGTT